MSRVLFVLLLGLVVPLARAEQPGRKVVMEVRGNLRVPTSTVLSLIRTREGRPFDAKLWDQDWHRLNRTGLFKAVRSTPALGSFGNYQKLVIDLTERPAYDDLDVKGVEEEAATKIREACAGFIGSLDTAIVRKSIITAVKELHGKDANVELATVDLHTHTQRVGGKEIEVTDAVRLVITVKPYDLKAYLIIGGAKCQHPVQVTGFAG